MENQRGRVDAVAESRWGWSVFKNMAEVAIAFTAQDFRTPHKKKRVLFCGNIFRAKGLVKTWPASA